MDRLEPHNLEAESALLGCLLLEPAYLDDIADRIKPGDFYLGLNGIVYSAMLSLQEQGTAIDKISLVDRLRKEGKIETIGGPQFLSGLMDQIPSAAAIDDYATMIADAAMYRRLIDAARSIAKIGYGDADGPETAIADALRLVEEAFQDSGPRHLSRVQQLMNATQSAFNGQSDRKVLSPFPFLNHKIGGFYAGEMYLWAGGPKVGKSYLELNIADSIARNHGLVVIFALEMGQQNMRERQLAIESGVSVREQRDGNLSPEQREKLMQAEVKLYDVPIEIVDYDVRSIPAMRRMLRKLTRTERVKSIFIDHIGLTDEVMRESKHEGKVERLERAYGACLKLAQEFACSVHVIQHINREGSKSLRPTEHDIRGGGNPNGLAHATLLVHRDDPTNADGQGHLGEIIVSSTRNGEPGSVRMHFDGPRGVWTQPTPFITNPIPQEWGG